MYITDVMFYFYEKQHEIHLVLLEQINHMTIYSCLLLLISGVFTSISPCMTSCIPIIVSYIPKKQQTQYTNIIFISGIITSILAIGISLILIKRNTIFHANHNISFITPCLYLIIGLSILEIIKINFPVETTLFNNISQYNNLFVIYIFGISIGINISPCSTPILTSLIIWITNTKHLLVGIGFLGIYTLGYLSPIILYLISLPYFNKIKISYENWELFPVLTGGLLITTSTFSLCTLIFL
jgi:cytochrome c-type biogenesis protein